MKPLHLCCDPKHTREFAKYIQLKNGFFTGTDGFIGCKIPANEVLSDVSVIHESEELYFKADEWKSANMHKAVFIHRDGLYFKALDKKSNVIGTIEAQEAIELDFTYPPFDTVIPDAADAQDTKVMHFNTELMDRLATAMGYPKHSYSFTFISATKPLLVTTSESDKAVGICIPIYKP